MAAVVIVGVEPGGERGAAFGFGPVGAGVGPFLEQGAVEPFDLAVGLWPVGPGSFMRDPVAGQLGSPQLGDVAGAVEFLTDVNSLEGS